MCLVHPHSMWQCCVHVTSSATQHHKTFDRLNILVQTGPKRTCWDNLNYPFFCGKNITTNPPLVPKLLVQCTRKPRTNHRFCGNIITTIMNLGGRGGRKSTIWLPQIWTNLHLHRFVVIITTKYVLYSHTAGVSVVLMYMGSNRNPKSLELASAEKSA